MLRLEELERLSRWKAGELDAIEAAQVQALVSNDVHWQQAASRLEALDEALASTRNELLAFEAKDTKAVARAIAVATRSPALARAVLAICAALTLFFLGWWLGRHASEAPTAGLQQNVPSVVRISPPVELAKAPITTEPPRATQSSPRSEQAPAPAQEELPASPIDPRLDRTAVAKREAELRLVGYRPDMTLHPPKDDEQTARVTKALWSLLDAQRSQLEACTRAAAVAPLAALRVTMRKSAPGAHRPVEVRPSVTAQDAQLERCLESALGGGLDPHALDGVPPGEWVVRAGLRFESAGEGMLAVLPKPNWSRNVTLVDRKPPGSDANPSSATTDVVLFIDVTRPQVYAAIRLAQRLRARAGIRLTVKVRPRAGDADSTFAARFLVAVSNQGRLWEVLEKLEAFHAIKPTDLRSVAAGVSLDFAQLERDIDPANRATTAAVNADLVEATRFGVVETPQASVNGRVFRPLTEAETKSLELGRDMGP